MLSLAKIYRTVSEKGKYLKKFFGQPFLPSTELYDYFIDDIMSMQPAGCAITRDFTDLVFLIVET